MAKYGKKASKKVEKAMHEKKKGTLKSGSGKSNKQETGDCDWIVRGQERRRQGAAEKSASKKKSSSRKK